MANLNKGTTFVSGGEVTAAKLNDMVDNATITDITATDLASNNAMVTIGTAPANKAGNLYFDNGSNSTFGAKNGELLVYSGGMFHSAAENVETVMTFLSTESPVVGSVMTLDTTTNDQVKMSSVANDTSVVGVVAETSSTKARVVRTGYAKVKCNASLTDANRGNYLVASATAGQATTASVIEAGTFGRIMSIDLSDDTIAYAMIFPATQPSGTAYMEVLAEDNNTAGTAYTSLSSNPNAVTLTVTPNKPQPFSIKVNAFIRNTDAGASVLDDFSASIKEGSTTLHTIVSGQSVNFGRSQQVTADVVIANTDTASRTITLTLGGSVNDGATYYGHVQAVQWKVV